MTPGRIAVIITCRDLGRTLRDSLASAERQSRTAAEINVVDDKSTDIFTRQVLARLEREGTHVVGGPGCGASAARNLGATLTSAEYLVWLDADDTLETGYFEAAGAVLDANPDLDFVSCAMRAFEGASYVWKPSPPTFVDAIATGGVPHASTMIRRRLWEGIGGFDESLQSFELLDFWASVIERGHRGVILNEPLLNYRVRAGSGYRRSIEPDTYLARLRHFYGKHHAAVEQHALELIHAKEAFLVSQREYTQTLEARTAALENEIARLKLEIAGAVSKLEASGLSRVDWGDLRRVQPLSQYWGWDRGRPVDRHYIDGFLETHRADVRGRVLEVRDPVYTQRFGGEAVTNGDVIDIDPRNGLANVIADLRCADRIAAETYDCIILTQTLQLIDDMPAVISECSRMLRPGGVLLATVPSVIRVDDEGGLDGDFWRLTEASARKLFAGVFPVDAFDVTAYGNVLSATAFLYGLSVDEIGQLELDHVDPIFPVVIAIRAVKPKAVLRAPARATRTPHGAAILVYHRIASLRPDSHALCTPPDQFREQMKYISRECHPIGLDDLLQAAASGQIPERAVAVTLDDGYLDGLTTASPMLSELGVPATFFINSDRLDVEHERWWDIFEQLFLESGGVPLELRLTVGEEQLQLSTRTPVERAEALNRLNQAAWPLDASGRQRMLSDVLAWSGGSSTPRSTHRLLTSNELRTLASRPGHAIGSHSVHHLALTTQPSATVQKEISDDRAALQDLLQRPVHLFSYPYGDFNAATVSAVANAGFRAAVTVQPGLVKAGINRLLLPRYEVTAADFARFPLRLQEMFADCSAAPSGIG